MNTEAYVEGVVIDICSRSFLLISDLGEERFIKCDTPEEFMSVLNYVREHAPVDTLSYVDPS